MTKSFHVPVIVILALGLAGTIAIGLTGQFTIYNKQGLLSGSFSGLLLLGATEAALLALIALDWRIWRPARIARAKSIEQWLFANVLGTSAPTENNWQKIHGKFSSRDVSIQRTTASGVTAWRWSIRTSSPLQFHLTRLDLSEERRRKSAPPTKADPSLSTEDAEFEERYDWQSAQPEKVLAVLKQDESRGALKRLASLFAQHGKIESEHNGIILSNGELSLLQCPAPEFSHSAYFPDELLLILHDLALVVAAFEGSTSTKVQAAPAAPIEQDDTLSAWIALGCAGALAIVIWMGVTYFLARSSGGLPAAMIGFFVPPVALALWFVVLSGRSTHPETDAAIRRETARIMAEEAPLAKIRFSRES
jgi:hypothetical protein